MTREDIIINLRHWCNNIDKPCEECKIHDICVVRDHVQIFDSMDDKKLQEYFKLMYGSEVKVEKMEPVKVLKEVTRMIYPNRMEEVIPIKEFVKNITDKGYKVMVRRENVIGGKYDVVIYEEEELKE